MAGQFLTFKTGIPGGPDTNLLLSLQVKEF